MLIARIGRHGQLGAHTSSVGLTHIEHYRIFSWMVFQDTHQLIGGHRIKLARCDTQLKLKRGNISVFVGKLQ